MKKVLIGATMAVIALGLCAAVAVNAQFRSGDGSASPLVQKLVERFNLNAEEVQEVFEEAREEMRQETQARFEERIGDEANRIGLDSLTDEQKEALSAKREELRERVEAFKNLSAEERQTKMEELRGELEAWAEENGIDSEMLFGFGFGRGFKGGHFGPCGKFGSQPDADL